MTTKTTGWRAPLAAVALLLLLQAGGTPVREALRYDRSAILHGELWRLLTAHLVHLGWTHTLLNAAGLLLSRALAPERLRRMRWPAQAALLLVLAGTVSSMLLAFSPGSEHYVGLSGVLYGLFALMLLTHAREGRKTEAAALAGLVAWAGWQWLAGPSAQEERWIGGHIVASAHVYGLIGAAGLWAACLLRARVASMSATPR